LWAIIKGADAAGKGGGGWFVVWLGGVGVGVGGVGGWLAVCGGWGGGLGVVCVGVGCDVAVWGRFFFGRSSGRATPR